MRTICAWCQVLMVDGDPAEVSHGLCAACADRLEHDGPRLTTAPVQDASGRVVAPPQNVIAERPMGNWDSNA